MPTAVTPRPIAKDNLLDSLRLKLKKEKFVSHPIRSLAQIYVYRSQCQPFGVNHDDAMVGCAVEIYGYDVPEYDVWHMMIDESQQVKGFGMPRNAPRSPYMRHRASGRPA